MLFIPNKASEKQLKFSKCLQEGGHNGIFFPPNIEGFPVGG